MISAVDMKEVRHKAYSAYFADGLGDILLAIFIIMLAAPLSMLIALPCYYVGYFILTRVRRKVTYPRTGYVKIARNHRLVMIPLFGIGFFAFIMLSLVILGAVFAFSTHRWGWPFYHQSWFSYTMTPGVAGFVAYYFRVKRWYLYALLTLVSVGLEQLFWLDSIHTSTFVYPFVVLGAIILLSGTVIFIRFLQNNPEIVLEQSLQELEAKI